MKASISWCSSNRAPSAPPCMHIHLTATRMSAAERSTCIKPCMSQNVTHSRALNRSLSGGCATAASNRVNSDVLSLSRRHGDDSRSTDALTLVVQRFGLQVPAADLHWLAYSRITCCRVNMHSPNRRFYPHPLNSTDNGLRTACLSGHPVLRADFVRCSDCCCCPLLIWSA